MGKIVARRPNPPYEEDSATDTCCASQPVCVDGELYRIILARCAPERPDVVTVEEPPEPGPYILFVNVHHPAFCEETLADDIRAAIKDFFGV